MMKKKKNANINTAVRDSNFESSTKTRKPVM